MEDRRGQPAWAWGRRALLAVALLLVAWLGWRSTRPVAAPQLGGGSPATQAPEEARSALMGRAPDTAPALAASTEAPQAELEITLADGAEPRAAIHVFLADARLETSLTVDAREDELRLVLPDGRSPLRARDVRATRAGAALRVQLGSLPTATSWFVAARAVLEDGAVVTAPSTPVLREPQRTTALVLGQAARVLGGLTVSVRRGEEVLPECAVSVVEVSGLPHGRHRFVEPRPVPAMLPADVPLHVTLSDARGMATLGAPASQTVTLGYGTTKRLVFELPEAVALHVRAETPRGEAVDGGLLLWSLDAEGRLEPVPVADALAHSGAWGYAGHLPPGRYVGAFSPDTEWPVRTFRVDLGADSRDTVVTLDLAPTAQDALVHLLVRDEDGTRLGGERLMFERVVDDIEQLDWGHARTDPSGATVVRPLRPGTYRVVHFGRQVARTIELAAGRQDVELVLPAPWPTVASGATGDAAEDDPVVAPADEEGTPAEALAVRLVGPDGAVRPLAWVHVRPEGATWWRIARAAPQDTTLFPALPTGPYEIWVPTSWSRHPDVAEARARVLVQQGAGLTSTTLRLAPR